MTAASSTDPDPHGVAGIPARLPRATLVLGGQRSGKSALAERLVESQPGALVYFATAQAHDAEMAARIAHHKARRGPRWRTREEPLALAAALPGAAQGATVLVDCLTLWLSNLLGAEHDPEAAGAELTAVLPDLPGRVVLVSNEVGQGVVPANALARAFVDHAGRLHQTVAAACDCVIFVTAGCPQLLKAPEPVSV